MPLRSLNEILDPSKAWNLEFANSPRYIGDAPFAEMDTPKIP
jgi:hypothetical protein